MTVTIDGQKIPGHKPKCPNHGCPLEGCGFPLPKKGTGMCPVSGARFAFEAEVVEGEASMAKDKKGNITPKVGWKISGND